MTVPMEEVSTPMKDARAGSKRDKRLAEALRRNLRLRKAQAKSRRSGDADGRSGLENGGADGEPMDEIVFKGTESPDDSER